MIKEIKIPEIGENVTDGTVVGVLVSEGDTVEAEQSIIEFETDKAVVEIPSPAKGKITEISVSKGDTIGIDEVIAKLETEEDVEESAGEPKEKGGEEEEKAQKKEAKEEEEPEEDAEEEEEEEAEAKEDEEGEAEEEEEEDKAEEKKPPEDEAKEKKVEKPKEKKPEPSEARKEAPSLESREQHEVAPAAPSVRRLARELGADINRVPGTGPGGRISVDDVKAHVKEVVTGQKEQAPGAGRAGRKLPDFSRWGDVRREKMSRVRSITADSVGYAWNVVPHVTQFDKADITGFDAFRDKYAKLADKAGGKLTITSVILKVLAAALQRFPRFNASIDADAGEVVYKDYCHIGMAVDTDRGLLVPVIRDVDKKSIVQLSVDVVEMANKARDKKISPEEMEGGTFTISNQGGIGGTDFTPIVFWPQVAILGVSRGAVQPVYADGEFKPRTILPLSLSYDHRIIDGADAARFLRFVCEALENPLVMHLESQDD